MSCPRLIVNDLGIKYSVSSDYDVNHWLVRPWICCHHLGVFGLRRGEAGGWYLEADWKIICIFKTYILLTMKLCSEGPPAHHGICESLANFVCLERSWSVLNGSLLEAELLLQGQLLKALHCQLKSFFFMCMVFGFWLDAAENNCEVILVYWCLSCMFPNLKLFVFSVRNRKMCFCTHKPLLARAKF